MLKVCGQSRTFTVALFNRDERVLKVVRNSRYIVRYQPHQTPLFIDEESKPVGSNGWLSLLGARHLIWQPAILLRFDPYWR